MDNYPVGVTVPYTLELVEPGGDPIAETSLSWSLFDELDHVLSGPNAIAITTTPQTAVVISIPPALNTLPDGVATGLRVIELTVGEGADLNVITQMYIIRSGIQLVVLNNSFQTYRQAQLQADSMPNLLSWSVATDQARVQAMTLAFRRLIRLGYEVTWPIDFDSQNTLYGFGTTRLITPRMWPLMTIDRYTSWYPEQFRLAMRCAQIAEANQILTFDPLVGKRLAGIQAETVGESATVFKRINPVDLGISQPAMEYLIGYVKIRTTMSRV
jgi:hypothetical protein